MALAAVTGQMLFFRQNFHKFLENGFENGEIKLGGFKLGHYLQQHQLLRHWFA
jgi:hypothetical protein